LRFQVVCATLGPASPRCENSPLAVTAPTEQKGDPDALISNLQIDRAENAVSPGPGPGVPAARRPQGPLPLFHYRKEFIVEYLVQRPEGFDCDWAWDDIHKILMILLTRGNFGTWMKDPNQFITCRTDGIKPVVFKIERLEETFDPGLE
jgi:uncharacterized repeat protein (TIGR04076 family)